MRAIQYGYDASRFQPASASLPPQSPVVVMHGSFDQHHLGQIALDTVSRIATARPEVGFRFVGRDAFPVPICAKTARKCAGRSIGTSRFIPYDAVAGQVRSATVGLVPYEESTGHTAPS